VIGPTPSAGHYSVPDLEKRKNIAQTHILDPKIAQITRNSRYVIIHVKRA